MGISKTRSSGKREGFGGNQKVTTSSQKVHLIEIGNQDSIETVANSVN